MAVGSLAHAFSLTQRTGERRASYIWSRSVLSLHWCYNSNWPFTMSRYPTDGLGSERVIFPTDDLRSSFSFNLLVGDGDCPRYDSVFCLLSCRVSAHRHARSTIYIFLQPSQDKLIHSFPCAHLHFHLMFLHILDSQPFTRNQAKILATVARNFLYAAH